MYRVAVIDHDIKILKAVSEAINARREYDIALTTPHPHQLSLSMQQINPDVIIMAADIPDVDVFEALEQLRGQGITSEIIILGSESSYAHAIQALRARVFDICPKPLDLPVLDAILDRLSAHLEEKQLLRRLEVYSQLLGSDKDSLEILGDFFRRPLFKYIQAVSMELRPDAPTPEDGAVERDAQYLPIWLGASKCVIVINSTEDITSRLTLRALKQPEILRAGFSRAMTSPVRVAKLLMEAEITLKDSFVYPRQRVFTYRPIHYAMIEARERDVLQMYQSHNYSGISQYLSAAPKRIAAGQFGIKDVVYLWNRIVFMFQTAEADFPLQLTDMNQLTEQFKDVEEMFRFLNAGYWQNKLPETGTARDKFNEMVNYIDKHYSEDIKLKALCEKFYINESYCCILFRRHKQQTFSQYLTDVRIKKAKELLKRSAMPVSAICQQVGYGDYFYFNKLFKRKTGLTPNEYRKGDIDA